MPLDERVELRRASVQGPDRVAYAPRWHAMAAACLKWTDVVHLHSLFTYPIHSALRLATQLGVLTILRPCGLLHPYSVGKSRWIKLPYLLKYGSLLSRVSAWHYTSDAEADASWHPEKRNYVVLPNGVDPERMDVDRAAARRIVSQRWPMIGQAPFVLFLSRLHAKKRLDLLLEAFVQTAAPPWKLVVAGPDEQHLWHGLARKYVSALKDGMVVRLDAMHGAEKLNLLAAARWFALPSEHENFGIAALEALAVGTPGLLSPHVDLATEARQAGWARVAPLSTDAWQTLLRDALASAMPSAASDGMRRWVCHHYAWGSIATRLTQHYARLLGGQMNYGVERGQAALASTD